MTALGIFALIALAWTLVLIVALAVLRAGRWADDRMAELGVRKAIEREEAHHETSR